jgi:hypothetical protein
MAVVIMPHKKGGAARQDRPSSRTLSAANSITHRRQEGYAAPAAEDRREAAVLAEAAEMGYRLAVQCVDCRHWLSNPISVAAHRGPICRARDSLARRAKAGAA